MSESMQNLLHLRNKTCFPCLHSLVKTEANVWENSRADASRVFTCSRILTNSHKLCFKFVQPKSIDNYSTFEKKKLTRGFPTNMAWLDKYGMRYFLYTWILDKCGHRITIRSSSDGKYYYWKKWGFLSLCLARSTCDFSGISYW